MGKLSNQSPIINWLEFVTYGFVIHGFVVSLCIVINMLVVVSVYMLQIISLGYNLRNRKFESKYIF